MIEAMWSAKFKSSLGYQGDGIVVIINGKIMGGDSGFTYIGNCRVDNEKLEATLQVKSYANPLGMYSISGLNDYKLTLIGYVDHDKIILSGNPDGDNRISINVELKRIEELNWSAE